MAGVKGRSGGARPNTGGARPGAGRPPKPKPVQVPVPIEEIDDALQLLLDIAFGRIDATGVQLRAAIAAVQYTHTKTHDGGKKDAKQSKAEEAAEGLRPAAPPRLVSNG